MFWLVCALIGLVAGTLGGLLGVGGGVVMVPAFLNFLGMPAKQAVGTSMGVILFTAISASWRHWQLGNLDPRVVLPVALLSMGGAWVGASLTTRVPERTLRILFALFLVVTAADMLNKALRMEPKPADAASSATPDGTAR
jgi:uncharacterized membrane protein YfcA